MQKLLILLLAPLNLSNLRVQPFCPSRFALLGCFARKKRGNTSPLIQSVLADGRLQNLILNICPDASFHVDHCELLSPSRHGWILNAL